MAFKVEALNELALFAGGGGGILAGKLLGWRTVCAVEWEPYAQAILLARQADGSLDPFPIWNDVDTFDGTQWRGIVDVVSAGFPCQGWSSAGKRLGEADPRNKWPQTLRIISEVQPQFVALENSDELPTKPYMVQIIRDLEEAGYDTRWPRIIAASDVGAPHQRNRMWFGSVRHTTCGGGRDVGAKEEGQDAWASGPVQKSPDLVREGLEGRFGPFYKINYWKRFTRNAWLSCASNLGRVVYGIPYRVDRIKALGNAQVPIVAATAWNYIFSQED